MKRDWDIIRDILLKLEEKTSSRHPLQLNDFPKEHAEKYSYHVELLIEAGLIQGRMASTISIETNQFIAQRMTWKGHEFLDSIRSDNVWKKTKEFFVKGGLSMTYDLVSEIAKDVTTGIIKDILRIESN